jgi:hypothetical protein
MTNTQDTFEPNDSTVTINGRTYTHRTRDGRYARVICEDVVKEDSHPVIALVLGLKDYESLYNFTKKLMYWTDVEKSCMDLIKGAKPSLPETDWSKVAVDTPIWVRDGDRWLTRHFAKYDKKVYAFVNGGTSHTCGYLQNWNQATLTNPNT